MLSRNWCSILGAAGAILAARLALADSDVFVLRKSGGALVLEKVTIADGSAKKWKLGEDGFIDVILPPGPGTSGNIVQAATAPTVEAASKGGVLTVVTVGGNGQRYERTAPSAEELAALDIRVSARTGGGESLGAFIRGYQTAERDAVGPVEDMFAGRVPLMPGDCTVCTNTFAARSSRGKAITGSAPVKLVNGHHLVECRIGGATGPMVVDLAAGTTIVARKSLPAGTEIHESVMTQRSPEGVRRLAEEVGGATSAARPLGVATIPELSVGDIVFHDAEVMVMEELPPVDGGGIVGILGVDLLSRASGLSLPYGEAQGTAGSLKLGVAGTQGATVVPLSLVGTRAYCRGNVGATEVCFILDTGSPITILDEGAAKAAGIEAATDAGSVRGIGTEKASLRAGKAGTFSLGATEFADVPVRVGGLPLFASLRGTGPVGILGNDVLGRFARIEVDFDRSELRLCK